MNALELHAMALARGGWWGLLDALEVVARARVEPTFAGMLHAPGSLALLGYAEGDTRSTDGETIECSECDGTGDVEVVGATGRTKEVDCPWCDGDGRVDPEDVDLEPVLAMPCDVKVWRTLDGEPAEAPPEHIFDRLGGMANWTSAPDALLIVEGYRRLVERLAEPGVPA